MYINSLKSHIVYYANRIFSSYLHLIHIIGYLVTVNNGLGNKHADQVISILTGKIHWWHTQNESYSSTAEKTVMLTYTDLYI